MIILDLSQITYSNLFVHIRKLKNEQIEEDMLRHMVLNSIRAYNLKFRNEYGNMVIAVDGPESWRKKIYPYYKASRKKQRSAYDIDWKAVFVMVNNITDEIQNNFPYCVVHGGDGEADDVIATLTFDKSENEKVLIISADKDFKQLHINSNIVQFNPIKKVYVEEAEPDMFLREHILRGDSSDGIPNFLSDDDVFVVQGKRQNSLTEVRVQSYIKHKKPEGFCNSNMLRNYKRNEALIDLKLIPEYVKEHIRSNYKKEQEKDVKGKLFNYFLEKRLKNLMSNINDF